MKYIIDNVHDRWFLIDIYSSTLYVSTILGVNISHKKVGFINRKKEYYVSCKYVEAKTGEIRFFEYWGKNKDTCLNIYNELSNKMKGVNNG